jgi:hypothetical protein
VYRLRGANQITNKYTNRIVTPTLRTVTPKLAPPFIGKRFLLKYHKKVRIAERNFSCCLKMRCDAATLGALSDNDLMTLARSLDLSVDGDNPNWRDQTVSAILASPSCAELSSNFYITEFVKLAKTQIVGNLGIKLLQFADGMRAALPAMRQLVAIVVNCGDKIDNTVPVMLEGGGVMDFLRKAKIIGSCSTVVPAVLNDMLRKQGVIPTFIKWVVRPVKDFHGYSLKNKVFAAIAFLKSSFFGSSSAQITTWFVQNASLYAQPLKLAYALLNIYLKSRRSVITAAIAMLNKKCERSMKECIAECKATFHDQRIPVEQRKAHRLVGVCVARAMQARTEDEATSEAVTQQEVATKLTPLISQIDVAGKVLQLAYSVMATS